MPNSVIPNVGTTVEIGEIVGMTKGSLIAGRDGDPEAELLVGSNTQVLTADSGEVTGMKWATPVVSSPGGADTQFQYNDGGVFAGIASLTFDDTNDRIAFAPVLTSGLAQERAFSITVDNNKSAGDYSAFLIDMTDSVAGDDLAIEVIPSGGGTSFFLMPNGQWRMPNGASAACSYAFIDSLENGMYKETGRVFLRGDFGIGGRANSNFASVQFARWQGNQRTGVDDDESYISYELSQDTTFTAEFCRLTWIATDVTSTSKDGKFEFSAMVGNSLTPKFEIGDEVAILDTHVGMTEEAAASFLPIDSDVSTWPNQTLGIVVGTGGRIFLSYKNSTDVYFVEAGIDASGFLPGSTGRSVNQSTHNLAVNDVIRDNGTIYVKAQADSAANTTGIVGVVTAVAGVNDFTYTSGGFTVDLTGLTDAVTHFLSEATAGLLTTTVPTGSGEIDQPILFARSATEAEINIQRGQVIP